MDKNAHILILTMLKTIPIVDNWMLLIHMDAFEDFSVIISKDFIFYQSRKTSKVAITIEFETKPPRL